MAIRTDNITNVAGDGLPTLNGTSPTVKCQKKNFSGSATSATDLITFNNLSIGKIYKISANIYSAAAGRARARIVHNSVNLCLISTSSLAGEAGSGSVIFEAATTTATLSWESGQIDGSLEEQTFAIIEELPYHSLTTDFT